MSHHVASAPADIAVIGLGCRFPGAADQYEYWRNLREGIESIRFHSDDELRARGVPEHLLTNPRYVKASAPLDGAEEFDAAFWGFSAREAEVMDPQHRHFLECAYTALEDAGYHPARYDGLIGVYAGATMNTYLPMNLMANRGVLDVVGDLQIMIGNDKEYLASRVSYKLDLKGPSCVVQTACSSSLTAIHVATQAILSGECDMALAGGSSVRMPAGGGYLHQPGGTSSPDGHCRAFDARAGGSVVGSGAGVAVLKHLSDALRDGDHIYAVIKGSAVNNDGATKVSFTAPSVSGQARVAASAMLAARVGPEDIGYVEAHGTGTPLGDPIEVAALTQAFRETTPRAQFCALGSVKTNIGHLDAAAGIAGFIKAVHAVRHGLIPPTLHFETPNPELRLESSPFYVNNQLAEWDADGRPRRAAVHSIGMGGTNAHLILEEPPPAPVSDPAERGQLLVLSAATPTALQTSTERLARWLREHPAVNLADVAYTLQTGRRPLPHRRAVVVRDVEDAAYALDAPTSRRVATRRADPPVSGVAFLFPGQGTQFVGMAARLHEAVPAFRAAVDECLAALDPSVAGELRELLLTRQATPELSDRLRDTARAQPALFVVEYALATTLIGLGVRPTAMLGHSVGEIVAATVGGTLRLADALRLVTARGALLGALPGGAMLAVRLAPDAVRPYLEETVEVAAVNTPELTTVGGPTDAVDRTYDRLVAAGVSVERLHVSHAFHTAMVEPALDELRAVLDGMELHAPTVRWVSDVSGTWITPEEATDPGYWVRHARGAVRFADACATLAAEPQLALVEVGPGGVLTGLARASSADAWAETVRLLRGPQDRDDDRQLLLQGLGVLWAAGVEVDWTGLWATSRRVRVSLPTYPFEPRRFWVEAAAAPAVAVATAAAPADAAERQASVLDWWYAPVWSQLPPIGPGVPDDAGVLLLADRSPLADLLAGRLRAAGRRVLVAGDRGDAPTAGDHALRRDDDAGWDGLFARLRAESFRPAQVVVLWGLDAHPRGDVPAGTAGPEPLAEMAPLLSTVPAVRALHRHGVDHPTELVVVTADAVDVHGSDEVSPAQAAVLAAALLPQQEIPRLRARGIDLGSADLGDVDAVADRLAAELTTADAPPVVAHRGDRRWTRSFARWQPSPSPAAAWRRGGVYVVVGGLGFFGRTVARRLLEQLAAHVVLVDVREVPGDAAGSSLADLRRLAGSVEVVTCDCTDAAALTEVLRAAAARHGRVDAVLFAAGPAASEGVAALHELSVDALRPHLVRLAGLHALDAAVRDVAVGTCLVVTSLASVLGGLGSAPYTATTLWADAFAAGRGAAGPTRWRSVAWEHWRRPGEMSLGGQRERYAIDPEELAETVELALQVSAERLAVSTAPLDARAALARRAVVAPPVVEEAGTTDSAAHGRPDVRTPFVAARTDQERYVAGVMAQLLGIDRVGVRDNFFELGGDSLMAMQLLSHLRDHYRVAVPMSDLFADPTVASLVGRIGTAPGGADVPAPGPATVLKPESGAVSDAEIEEILASAPPEDVQRLLLELEREG